MHLVTIQEKLSWIVTTEWNDWYYNSQQDFESVRTTLGISKTKLNGFLTLEILPNLKMLEKMEELIE